jgi:hypothetical protein
MLAQIRRAPAASPGAIVRQRRPTFAWAGGLLCYRMPAIETLVNTPFSSSSPMVGYHISVGGVFDTLEMKASESPASR